MSATRVLLAEVTATDGVSTNTFRWTDTPIRPFAATDPDRANALCDPRLLEGGDVSLDVYADLSRLEGALGAGDLVVSNADGSLSGYRTWRWQDIGIYLGRAAQDGTPDPFATWTCLLKGRVERPQWEVRTDGPSRLRLAIHDKRADIEQDVQTRLYLGTNVGATGYEGLSDDLKGKPVPLALGDLTKANITPPRANGPAQVLQINDGGDFTTETIRDRGGDANLVRDADLTGAAFDAASPVSGHYLRDRTRGLLKYGGGLGGTVTVGMQGTIGAGGYTATAPALIKRLLERRGTPPGDIGASFGTLSAPAACGLWLPDATTYAEAIGALARGFAGWAIPDAAGVWQVGRLTAPSGPAALTIDQYAVRSIEVDDSESLVPAKKITVRYARNYTVMREADLAGAVIGTDRARELAEEWRTAVWTSPTIAAAYPNARELTIDTPLVAAADAQALADSLGALFGVARESWRVVVELDEVSLGLRLGDDCVQLDYPQQAISGLYRVIGKRPLTPARHLVTLRLWG
ncbi:hypothetical protein D3874_03005 [Oleomonas cavernae]|uniref:Tip attachment protein J domain-containing protein n=1 Tax=Oleomonas cavernae TaxID=2320859 RepID=A0A418WUH2_9PROT|nr:hypothetical protein [Oleomonas cavernae]RJF94799.1 hypothetical protein D3874_03005 [Oleomonas cavernae]